MMEPSQPAPQKTYEEQFKQGVSLFEKSFKQMDQAKFEAQKDQYVKVMQESLGVMQEAASSMLNDRLVALKEKLSTDLDTYLNQPTQENRKTVQSDIERIKQSD